MIVTRSLRGCSFCRENIDSYPNCFQRHQPQDPHPRYQRKRIQPLIQAHRVHGTWRQQASVTMIRSVAFTHDRWFSDSEKHESVRMSSVDHEFIKHLYQYLCRLIVGRNVLSSGDTCSPSMFGIWCNSSRNPCVYLQPCLNNGTCFENITERSGYVCQCQPAFQGIDCEVDRRPCQSFSCFERGEYGISLVSCHCHMHFCSLFLETGECNATSTSSFNCKCSLDYDGERCQSLINYCSNITCLNRGVCFSRYARDRCLCLDRFYYGRRCEFLRTNTKILNAVSKGKPRSGHSYFLFSIYLSVSFP